MAISPSIHDPQGTPIVKTPIETSIERSQVDSELNPSLKTESEPEINMEIYSSGWFDGLMGFDAQLPHFKDYWEGYQLGYREYCCGLLGVEIPESEMLEYRVDILSAA